MSGIVLQKKECMSKELFANSTYVDLSRNRNFLFRSEHSELMKLFMEFDSNSTEETIIKTLEHQMKYYLDLMTSKWVSALVWEDSLNTVITICPINGAA